MSAKNRDRQQRWRCVTVGFRMSKEESDQLNRLVALSGMTKQDYIIDRLLNRAVVVVGNPRVHKALKDQMTDILQELRRITSASKMTPELCELIQLVSTIYSKMEHEGNH
jgi:hypothetical protein